jgi:ribonuclease BN (tRNA processing enzyme)
MKLTILGSGTCVPNLKRSSSANFLKILNRNVIIDFGPGTMHQMLRAKIDYKKIDFVFLTHFHPDHVSELRPFIQALDWTPNFDRKKDLILIGPVGFKEFYKRTINSKPRPNTYKIKIKEIKKNLALGDLKIECVKTVHSDESVAYKFTEKTKSIVITGDCDYDTNLIKFSKNSNLLLIECSFPNDSKVKGHLTPKECGEIAKQAGVKKLVLTHLYPTSPEILRLNETKKIFRNTILAKDLLTIDI